MKIALFESQLAIAAAKGYLEEDELNKFIGDFKDVLSEKEIRSRIKVKIIPSGDQAKKEEQQLEPTTVKEINARLKSLQLTNLYELFAMPRMTSSQELCRAATELYDDMVHRPKSEETKAKAEHAGARW